MATKNNQANALITLYLALCQKKYGKAPTVNRYREKWAMVDVIDSIGYEKSVELMKFYFDTERISHPLSWFYYNFDKLAEAVEEAREDERRKELIRKKTRERVEEWKANK